MWVVLQFQPTLAILPVLRLCDCRRAELGRPSPLNYPRAGNRKGAMSADPES